MLAQAVALARTKPDHRSDRRLCPGVEVSLWNGHVHGRPVLVAGQKKRPGRRGDREIGRGPARLRSVLAERRDGDRHQPRIDFCQSDAPQAESLQARRRTECEQDVGRRRQTEQMLSSLGRLEVERDTTLVAVERPEMEALVHVGRVAREGPDGARAHAARRLD